MRKIVNFRPILIFTMSLILGGYLFVGNYKCPWIMWVLISAICALIALGLVILIKQKSTKWLTRILGLIILPVLVGGMVVNAQVEKRLSNVLKSGYYTISGTVSRGGGIEGTNSIYLDNVSLYGNELDYATPIEGSVKVYNLKTHNPEINLYVGDRVTMYGKFDYFYEEIVQDNPLSVDMCVGKVVYNSGLTVVHGEGVKYNILKWSRDQLLDTMEEDEAMLSYAMLFGDKELLNEEVEDYYRGAGLAHILAVSGLHVGFISLLIGFILKRIIKNKWVFSLVFLAVMIAYSYLCGFSASIMRAVIMSWVVLLSSAFGEQYDGLNSLGIAGLANFIIDPLNIFNVGFLLSFFVVFSIFAISPQIQGVLDKRLPLKLSSSIALCISAWLGSIPIILFYFHKLTLISGVVNLIVIPFVSLIFITLVVCLMLSAIPMCAEFFLDIPELFIKYLTKVAKGFDSLKFMEVYLPLKYLILVLGVGIIILSSEYIFIKRRWLYAGALTIGFVSISIIEKLILSW